ncbi:conjugative transfer signal peptidase TraF [Aquamicrobium lusatiense]|uniref:Conjugative transfer signal peptidase TraF n=1 Tax=Aquamicrobium lusatiense TaxID=89772 RepID=A0A7W9S5L0_9HYPH|nr:S26 family signal peptidase [Aquamicrobium lusatiense]MBB6014511.1 conjugative transfer signal peptidase TraF [Aquamicrobium lusatiense]
MTRARYVMLTAAALATVIASIGPTAPKLVWNASASVPIGFYTIAPADRLEVPDLVAVMPPESVAGFMVARGYVARDVPLLKHVVGLPGQRLCRDGRAITVDGIELGEALERDSRGRDLPVWQGCRTIAEDEIFLMNLDVGDSLDGRYFGPFPASAVIGRAIPLFTDEDGDGRLVWRAPER